MLSIPAHANYVDHNKWHKGSHFNPACIFFASDLASSHFSFTLLLPPSLSLPLFFSAHCAAILKLTKSKYCTGQLFPAAVNTDSPRPLRRWAGQKPRLLLRLQCNLCCIVEHFSVTKTWVEVFFSFPFFFLLSTFLIPPAGSIKCVKKEEIRHALLLRV